ncbi:flagellar basal body rod protein FlgC [Massilia sp. CCM 8695]|uniref:Flagellar basal-body rod protein FlgC n=1 Tax=Massilia frigida TaxID=2609281 RepID=A0ABX0ND23_9BURK|nr:MULTISPECIES: flagellar basal body rod protein FlgC [Massilia]MDM5179194.1 flagellar basal body rod protein FlgC [Massilia sp. DJPM01]NHZ80759.1 flagellar basal body rod protein FlgC [Massilia frigida]
MDQHSLFQISASGMAVEKLRLDVSTANLANMHSTAGAGKALYRPLQVISRAVPLTFSEQMGHIAAGGAEVASIAPQEVAPRMVFEPAHPDADAKGFVAYPGVNQTSEMMTMLSALRAYEANVVALKAAKTMASRALEIGGQS